MIQIIKGDLLEAKADIICHQVNCRNVMGSGVAKALFTKWPEVKSEYHNFCQDKDMRDLLGEVQIVDLPGGIKVANIFGQLDFGNDGQCYTNYVALQKAFTKLNKEFSGKTLAFPYRFGCGLAGGNWDTVQRLLLNYFTEANVKIYYSF